MVHTLDTGNPADLREIAGCSCPKDRQPRAARVICKACGGSSVVRLDAPREEYAQDVVTYVGQEAKPPSFAIAAALLAATCSPCHKSKRGVAVYRMLEALDGGQERVEQTLVQGYNGPPWLWTGDDLDREMGCDGSEACRRDCGRRCVHAEARALLSLPPDLADAPSSLRLVHVGLGDDHRVVAGKGPSCEACSKTILDQGVGGIWLYERLGQWLTADGRKQEGNVPGIWRYYPARDFHEITCLNLGIYQVRRRAP
jgi:deoxycytidylate deaminase